MFKYNISKENPLKVLSLFSGIGAFEKGLEILGIPYELVNYCEIDKFASTSYSAIHNVPEELNLGDITEIDIDKLSKNIDLITHGSPCTNFSYAGKGAGGDENSGTQSSLMWYTVKIVDKIRPKFIIWENVRAVLGQKHKHNFNKYINKMNELNYNSYYQIFNSKNYGTAQNRERVFVVSIRKDIDTCDLVFEKPQLTNLRLKDYLLEDLVTEKYFLSETVLNGYYRSNKRHEEEKINFFFKPHKIEEVGDKIAKCLTTRAGGRRGDNYIEYSKYRVRKLMPEECFLLMNFTIDDCNKARKAMNDKYHKGKDRANTQLFKQAGNSICVNVIISIYKSLFLK